ncbi:hypothetical protein GH714_035620 [Hevea brasiliensis]|uniref:Uncharacterized protein n=1 Tax=Hevea brasiliensis TaxID=3981 RepID=A0A6A6KVP2_HEVBR|nr:hypothetical protein GH714_035620 [Hevea brasiliensis]
MSADLPKKEGQPLRATEEPCHELLTLLLTKNILASSSSGNSDDEVDSPVDDADWYTDVDEADSLDGITLSGDKSLGPANSPSVHAEC